MGEEIQSILEESGAWVVGEHEQNALQNILKELIKISKK